MVPPAVWEVGSAGVLESGMERKGEVDVDRVVQEEGREVVNEVCSVLGVTDMLLPDILPLALSSVATPTALTPSVPVPTELNVIVTVVVKLPIAVAVAIAVAVSVTTVVTAQGFHAGSCG